LLIVEGCKRHCKIDMETDQTSRGSESGAPTEQEKASGIMEFAFQMGLPKLYFNGFICGISPSDLSLVLQQNNNPIGVVFGSHQAMRALSVRLKEALDAIELQAKIKITASDEIAAAMMQAGKKE